MTSACVSTVTIVRQFATTSRQLNNRMGFGPNTLFRKGTYVVGTYQDPLKYHMIGDKKPWMPYGLQGTNHLNPSKGKINSRLPTRILMKKDKVYAWCACGYSHRQPICDGTHNSYTVPDLKLHPVRFIPDKDMEVWLCNCKQTKNRPFCDGSHKHLAKKSEEEELFEW